MSQPFQTQNPEIDELFERYKRAPQSTIFAPLADALRKAGMMDEALDICRKGLTANPTYASGYVVQGKCLYDAEKPEDAERSFRKVLELDGNNLVALKFIGIILAERGDTGAARACFEHILALDPEDRDIRRRLGEVEPPRAPAKPEIHGAGETETFASMPPREATEAPARPAPIAPVREAFDEDAGGDEDAFEGAPISLGADSGTTDEIATTTLADIYAAQGYTDKAMRIYREVLRRQPDNADLQRKIANLESRERRAAPPEVQEAPAPAPAEAVAAPAPAETTAAKVAPSRPASGNRIDETRSYEQFKRWLRSVSD